MAISRDPPERNAELAADLGLDFPVLSDEGLGLSRRFGIVFQAPGQDPLPVPAVYLVDGPGNIEFHYVHPNYRVRLDPELLLAAARAGGHDADDSAESDAASPDDARAWSLDTLREARAREGGPWHGFIRVPSLSAGLYVLPVDAEDRQRPHERDEIYHVLAGRAVLVVGEDRLKVRPGAILYVRARVPHRFVDIEEDLEVLVFFGGAEDSSAAVPPAAEE